VSEFSSLSIGSDNFIHTNIAKVTAELRRKGMKLGRYTWYTLNKRQHIRLCLYHIRLCRHLLKVVLYRILNISRVRKIERLNLLVGVENNG
jgi:hypothetical protein